MTAEDLWEDLRLLLQEEIADDFSDARIRQLTLMGLRRLHRYIRAVNPHTPISMYQADVVDATSDPERLSIYNWPNGTILPVSIRYRAVASDGYTPLDSTPLLFTVDGRNRSSQSGLAWAPWGQDSFKLHPAPTLAVANGLRVEVVEELSLSIATDVPNIHIGLHEAIPLLAKRRALFETGEQLSADEKANLADLIAEIPKVYEPASGAQAFLTPRVSKAY